MSGSKVNTYGIGDANIQALMLSTDKLFKGFHKVSLTNYDSTSESQIAAGSVIECAGALYKFDSNESMTGSPSDGTVYIRIVPGTTTCTAEYTNTAPTWSDAYQGWYGTGGAATYRYVEFILQKASSTWSNRYKFKYKQLAFLELSGTSDAGDAYTNISYPAGFTQVNTNVMSFKIYDTGLTAYRVWTDQGAGSIVSLGADIQIITTATQRGQLYKIILSRLIS